MSRGPASAAPAPAAPAAPAGPAWLAMPAVFVLIWSTGFVVARFGMPHSPPMTFLAWRFALSVAVLGLWVALSRAPWPRGRDQWLHLAATGVLLHAGYLGGVWAAVRLGIGAGTVALIVGLQPVLTALWLGAGAASARVARAQWGGLVLGLAGLLLVVWPRLGAGEVRPLNLALAVGALLAITAATLYQKRFVQPADVRSASLIQLGAAWLVTAPLSLLEPAGLELHPELLGAMAWSVLVLTLGGSSLLYLLIQRGAALRVTSLMYLVPPCTSVLAWWLFDETLGVGVLAGLALTAIGVALVTRGPRRLTAS